MVSIDRKIFEEDSAVRRRILEYGSLFEELHVIIFCLRGRGFRKQKISGKVWLHPTNSRFRFLAIIDAVHIGMKLKKHFLHDVGEDNNERIIVSSQDPFETGLAGWILAKRLHAKLQLQIHTDFLSPYFAKGNIINWLRVYLAYFLLPRADGIRVVSRRIKDSLHRVFRQTLPTSRVTVLPIFVEVRPIIEWKPVFQLRDKLPVARFHILMVSRLVPEKNIGLGLEILAEIMREYPLTGLVIIGEGTEKPVLIRRAQELGVDRNVAFLPWTTDVISAMKTANLFLLTSFYEGYGMTLIEAGLSGVPIVTCDVGAARELFKDREHALICPVGDKNCFRESVIRLIEDNELRENLRAKTRSHLEHLLSSKKKYLSNFKRSFERCFESLA